MIDVTHQINAVRRQVGTRTMDAGEARVLVIAQSFAADLDDMWDACTNPQRLRRWFLPVTGELELGGRYQLEGNASGTVQRCEPPRSFAATWEYGGEVSWIEVNLTEDGDHTLFELQHISHVDDERWGEYGPGAVGIGWDLTLVGLGAHLATGADNDPAEHATWAASAEGTRFVTLSSDGWYEAAVAAGTDPAAARAAADRTTGFYTAG
jgi:uncharacterized protein YndB with AHSA1/START domain